MKQRNKTEKAIALMLILGLLGCAGSGITDTKRTTGDNPEVAEVPAAAETVRGEDDPPVVTLELGSTLHERRLSETDDLPGNIIIPTTNLNAVPITAALQAVLSGTDVSLSWNTGALGDRLVTVMNLSGPLPKVVEKICAAAKVFCAFRHGSLELAEKETFIISLPPIAKATGSSSAASATGNSMADAITQLVGSKVQIDEQGGNIIYMTSVEGQERVSQYLEQLRNGRPLVVMQLYIWEVTLDKQNSEGINWSALKLGQIPLGPLGRLATSSTSAFTSITGGVSLGAITSGHLNTNSLLTFLSTQGRVQTISSPQVTFVSGSGAQFVAGGEQSYISSVGQLVAATNVSGTATPTTTGVGTNTVNLDKIKTGLTVNISGTYEGGVVFANLDLDLINLVSANAAPGGNGVQTPITSNRKVSTIIRVRPGDNLVMAGLVTSNDTNNREGIPLPFDGRLPTYGNDKLENNELVVMVKPSVILFSDKAEVAEAKKKETAKPLPEAVYIDKDGSKTLTVPEAQSAFSSALKPELMATVPPPASVRNVAIAPSEDGAPVDRRLMQRGFSHAFDDLLQPAPTPLAEGSSGTRP